MLPRFTEKVDVESSGCWRWTAASDKDGYGLFSVTGRMVLAHRFAYEEQVGPIPDDHDLHHTCEHPWCVNPAHLVPLTRLAHVAISRRFHPIACPHGHAFDEGNTYVHADGRRMCRTCIRERKREQRRRLRAAA